MCTYACLIDPTDNCSIKPVREAAFSKTTNSHKFIIIRARQKREALWVPNPRYVSGTWDSIFTSQTPQTTFPCFQRDADCSRIIILSGFWHCLGYPFPLYSHCLVLFLNSSWKWKYSATHIQKASLWMEAAFATETSVSHGNNTTKLFKMLCWCFCSPQPLGAGRSWAECFGYVTVIASRLGESMGDSFSIACLSDTRKYNSLASVFMTAGFVLPWTSQLPH